MNESQTVSVADLRQALRPNPRVVEDGGVKIVILQRGWVAVGRFSQRGTQCKLSGGATIRRWGTTNGLGQLATEGPTSSTVLDRCPDIEYHELTAICTMACEESVWLRHLRR